MGTTAKIATIISLPHSVTATNILTALHNHSLMMELNLLVKYYHLLDLTPSRESYDLPTSKSNFSITDRLSYLPCRLLQSEITYTAAYQNTETGLVTKVSAPLGAETISE